MLKRSAKNFYLLVFLLIVLITGGVYNNCAQMFKIFGGSEPISVEHRI